MSLPVTRRAGVVSLGCAAAVVLLVVGSFLLRTRWVHDQIFVGSDVLFAVNDSWYHTRLVQNLVHHFPYLISFDPYALFPDGQTVPVAPLFDWLLASASLIAGWGHPAPRTVDLVCAYVPAILGSLAVIPVYFLGRCLNGRLAGVLAAGLFAVSPGQFLSRSLLGYTDHHVAETVLSTLVVLLAVLGLRQTPQLEASSAILRRPAWNPLTRLLALGLLAGFVLGLYVLTWVGGAIFVGILTVWVLLQFLLDHQAGRSTDYLVIFALPMFFLALLMLACSRWYLLGAKYQFVALIGGIGVTLVLLGLARITKRFQLSHRVFMVLVPAAAVAGGTLFALLAPGMFRDLLSEFSRFGPGHVKSIIPEAAPLLKTEDGWSLSQAWAQFTILFFLAIPALAVLMYRGVRRGDTVAMLLGLWSVAMLAATLAQSRFAYYYAVNAALLGAYLVARILRWGWSTLAFAEPGAPHPTTAARPARPDRRKQGSSTSPGPRRGTTRRRLKLALLVSGTLAVLAGVFYPNINPALAAARKPYTPSAEWVAALHWMRENTPEPFGDASAYDALYRTPSPGEPYPYPASAYGVMCSWGCGYWITGLAHRIPVANPGQQGAKASARFYLDESETRANARLDRRGARYIVVDSTMPYLEISPGGGAVGKIHSLAHWADLPLEQFSETWYQRGKNGELTPFPVYYPAYYQSILARLYVFRGQAVQPNDVYVLSFRATTNDHGERCKELSAWKQFKTYAEAQDYFRTQPPQTTRLVGVAPYASCVPLEPLTSYRLVYRSASSRRVARGQAAGTVEIYEYVGWKPKYEGGKKNS
jgi:dolichyl-diphosphooligosaccharide--protein glycosyltransferase